MLEIKMGQAFNKTKYMTTELEHFILQQMLQCVSIELWPEWLLPEILQGTVKVPSPCYWTVQWISWPDSLTTCVLH